MHTAIETISTNVKISFIFNQTTKKKIVRDFKPKNLKLKKKKLVGLHSRSLINNKKLMLHDPYIIIKVRHRIKHNKTYRKFIRGAPKKKNKNNYNRTSNQKS